MTISIQEFKEARTNLQESLDAGRINLQQYREMLSKSCSQMQAGPAVMALRNRPTQIEQDAINREAMHRALGVAQTNAIYAHMAWATGRSAETLIESLA